MGRDVCGFVRSSSHPSDTIDSDTIDADTIDFGRELIPRLRAGAEELDRAKAA